MELVPCCVAPHAGLGLGREALESALTQTTAWVARLVCRAFRDARPPRAPHDVAASVGRCRLAVELGFPTDRVAHAAARAGSAEVLAWAAECGYPIGVERCVRTATVNGHLPVLQWMHDHIDMWREPVCRIAAEAGHLEVLKWAHGHQRCDRSTFASASRGGHMEVVRYLHASRCPSDRSACALAASAGNLEVLAWLVERGCTCHPAECLTLAAEGGHLHVLTWLRSRGLDWHVDGAYRNQYANDRFKLARAAASSGRVEVLAYVVHEGFAVSGAAACAAAAGGHVAVLEWLQRNGHPIDARAARAAAVSGKLGALQWLVAAGAPWDRAECEDTEHPHIVEWIRNN
jgi:hypothetical protein